MLYYLLMGHRNATLTPYMIGLRKGPLLGIAVVLTLFGVLMFGKAVWTVVYAPEWGNAGVPFLICAVAWIFAFNFFSAWLHLRDIGGE